MHWAVQPEWRYWTCRRFMGHFIGVHAHGGKYNGGLKKYRYDGWGVGNRCGRFIDTGHRNYWGPTKLSISFMYLFKSRQK